MAFGDKSATEKTQWTRAAGIPSDHTYKSRWQVKGDPWEHSLLTSVLLHKCRKYRPGQSQNKTLDVKMTSSLSLHDWTVPLRSPGRSRNHMLRQALRMAVFPWNGYLKPTSVSCEVGLLGWWCKLQAHPSFCQGFTRPESGLSFLWMVWWPLPSWPDTLWGRC